MCGIQKSLLWPKTSKDHPFSWLSPIELGLAIERLRMNVSNLCGHAISAFQWPIIWFNGFQWSWFLAFIVMSEKGYGSLVIHCVWASAQNEKNKIQSWWLNRERGIQLVPLNSWFNISWFSCHFFLSKRVTTALKRRGKSFDYLELSNKIPSKSGERTTKRPQILEQEESRILNCEHNFLLWILTLWTHYGESRCRM